jgi:hypothetical protein
MVDFINEKGVKARLMGDHAKLLNLGVREIEGRRIGKRRYDPDAPAAELLLGVIYDLETFCAAGKQTARVGGAPVRGKIRGGVRRRSRSANRWLPCGEVINRQPSGNAEADLWAINL